jgi:hypothetical protein
MIVEIIGPGGVGKTTVEPLVAERLGISYYPGRKRHGFHGEPVGGWRLWSGRLWSMMSRPGLSIAAFRSYHGSARQRAWFAMDICRRERSASRSRRLGDGVVASGPIHALCMMMGATGSDMSPMLARVTAADVYVRLEADAEVVTRRLAGRLGQPETDLGTHQAWMSRYEEAATRIFEHLDRPVIEVRADGAPDQVAEEIALRVRPFLDERPGVQG